MSGLQKCFIIHRVKLLQLILSLRHNFYDIFLPRLDRLPRLELIHVAILEKTPQNALVMPLFCSRFLQNVTNYHWMTRSVSPSRGGK